MRKRLSPLIHLPLAVFSSLAATIVVADPVPQWQVHFGDVGRPAVGMYEQPRLVRSAVANTVYVHDFGKSSRTPTAMVAPVDAWGQSMWSTTSLVAGIGYPQQLTALSDGTVISIDGDVSRLAADGTLLWSLPLPPDAVATAQVVEIDGNLVLLAIDARGLAWRIDRETGRVVEKVEDSAAYFGFPDAVVAHVVGTDTIYLASVTSASQLAKVRLNPLRFEWVVDVAPATGSGAYSIVADETGAYLGLRAGDERRVTKFSATQGASMWSTTGAYGDRPRLVFDIDGDLVVSGASVVEKLDRSSGARRWIHAAAGVVSGLDITAEAIVIAGSQGGSLPSAMPGFAQRLRRSDGGSEWSVPLAPPGGSTAVPTSIAVIGDRVLVAGVGCEAQAAPERCHLMYWPRALDGTGSGIHVPMFKSPSPLGRSVKASNDTTVGASLEYGPAGAQIRVKRLRNSDGQLLWEAIRPASMPALPGYLPYTLDVQVGDVENGAVAVLYGRPGGGSSSPHDSDCVILALDGADGTFRWQRSLLDTMGGFTDIGCYSIGVDPAGNVFAGINEGAFSGSPLAQYRREVRKYGAGDGAELLRIEFAPTTAAIGGLHFAPVIRIVGSDVLSQGHPSLPDGYALTRLDGSTGAVQWTNATLPFPYVSDLGVMTYIASQDLTLTITALDLVNGTPYWSTPYSHPADLGYLIANTFSGTDGQVYAGGYRRIPRPGSASAWDSRGILVRLDGQSGAISWVNRFDQTAVASPSGQLRPVFEHDGVIHSWQQQARSVGSPGYFFTGVSKTDGVLRGTQVVDLGVGILPRMPVSLTGIEVSGRAGDGDVIAQAGLFLPHSPVRFGIIKIAAPEAFAGGSLSVSMSSSVVPVGTDTLVSFVFETINDGALPANGVEALLAIPAYAELESIACLAAGSPCTATVMPSAVGLRRDLAIGDRIRISGSLRLDVRQINRPMLEASAFSPYGFVEMDMKDNIRSLRIDDVLFKHGFD